MWEKIKEIFTQTVYTILLPILAGAVMWALTRLVSLPAWEIFGAIIVAIGGTLLIVNQVEVSFERRKKKISKYSDEEIETTFRKWVDRRQYHTQHKTTPQGEVQVVVTDEQKRPINILFRPKDNPAVMRLVLVLDETEIAGIPPQDQAALRLQIAIEMARFGLRCNPNSPILVEIDLACDDLLTESVFLSAIDRIRQAHVLMSAHVGAVLGRIKAQAKAVKEQAPDKEGSQT